MKYYKHTLLSLIILALTPSKLLALSFDNIQSTVVGDKPQLSQFCVKPGIVCLHYKRLDKPDSYEYDVLYIHGMPIRFEETRYVLLNLSEARAFCDFSTIYCRDIVLAGILDLIIIRPLPIVNHNDVYKVSFNYKMTDWNPTPEPGKGLQ